MARYICKSSFKCRVPCLMSTIRFVYAFRRTQNLQAASKNRRAQAHLRQARGSGHSQARPSQSRGFGRDQTASMTPVPTGRHGPSPVARARCSSLGVGLVPTWGCHRGHGRSRTQNVALAHPTLGETFGQPRGSSVRVAIRAAHVNPAHSAVPPLGCPVTQARHRHLCCLVMIVDRLRRA